MRTHPRHTVLAILLCGILAVAVYAFSARFAPGPVPSPYAEMTTSLMAPRVPAVLADFGAESASADARQVANWIVASADNKGLPFVIIDKAAAKVFVFHPDGRIRGAAPALLGMGKGDEFGPGVLDKKMKDTRPDERVTPAGRFEAERGPDLLNRDLLWIDYDSSIALHELNPMSARQRRKERLESPTIEDNRITYGCVNVSVPFYCEVVQPAFEGTQGIVYVLPETRSASEQPFRATVDSDGVQRVEILGGDYFFRLRHIIVKARVPVELVVRIEPGIAPHRLTIRAPEAGIDIDAEFTRDARRITFTPTARSVYALYCPTRLLLFKSHRERGMESRLEVVDP